MCVFEYVCALYANYLMCVMAICYAWWISMKSYTYAAHYIYIYMCMHVRKCVCVCACINSWLHVLMRKSHHCQKPARSYLLLFVGIWGSLNLSLSLSVFLICVCLWNMGLWWGWVETDKVEIECWSLLSFFFLSLKFFYFILVSNFWSLELITSVNLPFSVSQVHKTIFK